MDLISNSLRKRSNKASAAAAGQEGDGRGGSGGGEGSLARTSLESTTSGFSHFPVWSTGGRGRGYGAGSVSGGRSGASASFSVRSLPEATFLQRLKMQPSTATSQHASFTGELKQQMLAFLLGARVGSRRPSIHFPPIFHFCPGMRVRMGIATDKIREGGLVQGCPVMRQAKGVRSVLQCLWPATGIRTAAGSDQQYLSLLSFTFSQRMSLCMLLDLAPLDSPPPPLTALSQQSFLMRPPADRCSYPRPRSGP